jgi:hypothetical protein
LIKSPNLYCEQCFDVYKKSKLKPLCRTKDGCPIADVAPLIHINKKANKFRQYKILAETKTPESILVQLLDESGLLEDLDSLVIAESYYARYRSKELSKQNSKRRK